MHSLCRIVYLVLTVTFLATTFSPVNGQVASPRKCITETCRTLKRQCMSRFKDDFRTQKEACREVDDRKACKKAEKQAFGQNRKACTGGFKSCRACCRVDQVECSIVTCGDGITVEGEECDDGNGFDEDGCDSNCTVTRCGNGIVTEGEECDDGNWGEGDGCSRECEVEDPELIACLSECRLASDSCHGFSKDDYRAALTACKVELKSGKDAYKAGRRECTRRVRMAGAQCKVNERQALKSCKKAEKQCKKKVKRALRSCKRSGRECGVVTKQALEGCQEAEAECGLEAKRSDKECTKQAREAYRECGGDAKNEYRAERARYSECRHTAGIARKQCWEEYYACTACCKNDPPQSCPVPRTFCPANKAGGPNLLIMTVAGEGDLDVGWTGVGHNQGVVAGVEVVACLQDCETDANPVCTGTGPVRERSLNGTTLGPPLPMLAADIAFCMVNEFTEDITVRKLNLQTGELEMGVKLNSVVHLTGDKKSPCPTCSGESMGAVGTCQGFTNAVGRSCTTEGITETFGNTSSDCLPFAADRAGELEVMLDPIASGTATLPATNECPGGSCPCTGGGAPPKMNECDDPGSCSEQVCIDNGGSDDVRNGIQPGVDQACCKKGREIIPCFIDDISRTGEAVPAEPLWPDPTYPKSATGKVAGVFCIPPTNSSVMNQPIGLGGPGAFVVPVETYVDFSP